MKFDAATHTYTNDNTNEKYTSVSELLGKYKKPFDVEFFSAIVARRRGVSQDVVKQEWKTNTENACAFGKDVHSVVEKYLTTGKIEESNIINEFLKVFDHNLKDVRSEILLWNDSAKIAGTSDIIVNVGKDFFDVKDVKTNKKFDFYNKYGEYLLPPVSHLQQCKYNSYGLQLSLYAYMYSQQTGRKPRQLSILYWNKTTFDQYYVPYMKWDVTVLLKHYNENKS